jgi:hypothetical protein
MNSKSNEFNLLDDSILMPVIRDVKDYTDKELLEYLKTTIIDKERNDMFIGYFYPNGFEHLKPVEFCSVGIVEHICYFPVSAGKDYIDTSASLQELGYHYWRRVKGDGNCYYRAVLINYIEILVLSAVTDNTPGVFFSLIKDLYFTEFPTDVQKMKDNTIVSLIFMYDALVKKDLSKCFDMLYRCYNKSDIIEKTLIQWLRFKLANFLKANLDFEVNGIKLVQLIPGTSLRTI